MSTATLIRCTSKALNDTRDLLDHGLLASAELRLSDATALLRALRLIDAPHSGAGRPTLTDLRTTRRLLEERLEDEKNTHAASKA